MLKLKLQSKLQFRSTVKLNGMQNAHVKLKLMLQSKLQFRSILMLNGAQEHLDAEWIMGLS